MQASRSYFNKTESNLLIPNIVLEEVVNKYKEELSQTIDKLRRLIPEYAIDIETYVAKYQETLKSKLVSFRTEYLDYPSVSHEDVSKRAIHRKKPFSSSGSGYADALIWETILAYISSNHEQVILVTTDSRDFSQNNHLHQDLVADLDRAGVPKDSVTLYTTLYDFVKEIVIPQLDTRPDIEYQLSKEKFAPLNLRNLFENRELELKNALYNHFINTADHPLFTRDFERSSISLKYPQQRMAIIGVYKITVNTIVIHFHACVDVTVDPIASKTDYPLHLQDQWNKWLKIPWSFVLSCVVIFDLQQSSVTSYQIELIGW